MSHIVKEEWNCSDLQALWAACRQLGLSEKIGQKTHRWYGRFMNDSNPNMTAQEIRDFGKCDHAIEVPGSDYEIGVYKRTDGKGYYLAFDHWGIGCGQEIEKKLGTNLERLKQAYTEQLMKMTARRHGHQFASKALPNGKVAVTITVGA